MLRSSSGSLRTHSPHDEGVAHYQTVAVTPRIQAMSKKHIRELTTAIGYVTAVVDTYILKDFDMLPLQSHAWQTNKVCTSLQIFFFGTSIRTTTEQSTFIHVVNRI